MWKTVLSLVVILVASTYNCQAARDCRLKINDKELNKAHPLLLRITEIGGQVLDFYIPDNNGYVELPENTDVRLACIGEANSRKRLPQNSLVNVHSTHPIQTASATITCPEQDIVLHIWPERGAVLQFLKFKDIFCKRHPDTKTFPTNIQCNNNMGLITKIGFQDGLQFYVIMYICFERSNRLTFWSKYDLRNGIQGKASADRPGKWADSGACLGVNPVAYTKIEQEKTFDSILGTGKGALYIKDEKEHFLVRGHLTAMADFVYGSQQVATCDYINAAPQWQSMNNGNWVALEARVRLMASSRNLDLQVFTGTHGVTHLEGKNLYLASNIPVPAVFWKLVFYQAGAGSKAVLFISANNPYLGQVDPIYSCVDRCSQLPWLTPSPLPRAFKQWLPKSQERGFTTCCQLNELPPTHALRDVVHDLPGNVGTLGLLV